MGRRECQAVGRRDRRKTELCGRNDRRNVKRPMTKLPPHQSVTADGRLDANAQVPSSSFKDSVSLHTRKLIIKCSPSRLLPPPVFCK